MFGFFKKKPQVILADAPELIVDIHSHLIPAIDDGAQSEEESLSLLRALQYQGYKKIVTTPHIMIDTYDNTQTSILQGLDKLRTLATKHQISLQIEAAAEYYLDEGLLPLIKKKEILLIENKYLLFETSYNHRPAQLEEIIFEILAAGYIPLLAHPERYNYIKDTNEFHKLKEIGVLFQVNINSFNGYYGSHAEKYAHYLSSKGLIDFLGSDTHNGKHIQNLKRVIVSDSYKEIFLHNIILNSSLL